jgi:hypothetical protein
MFASLANVKAQLVPYSKDIADNRRKYGESMLRKAEDHLAAQRQHETDALTRLEVARRKRQEERNRQEAAEVGSFISAICNNLMNVDHSSVSFKKSFGLKVRNWRRSAVSPANKRWNGLAKFGWIVTRRKKRNPRKLGSPRVKYLAVTKVNPARNGEANSEKLRPSQATRMARFSPTTKRRNAQPRR